VPETALVTGASSGIGEQFARQLAVRGWELVLVARRADRLEALAEDLPTTAQAIPCDLATEAASLREKVAELGVDVDLLVNNAGFGTSGPFLDHDPARDAEQVRLNCEAIVTLAHDFLPPMVERGRGGIINVASTAGMQPLPYESVYAATKAFAISFTDALHTELRGSGVRVLAVNPGAMQTEFFDAAGSQTADLGTKRTTPEHVVTMALDTLDRRSAPPSIVTNSRSLTVLGRLLSRRHMVRLIGGMARRAQAPVPAHS